MPDQKPKTKAGRRRPPMSKEEEKRRAERRAAAVEIRGRQKNTAEIMAHFAREIPWTQTEEDKDLYSGKRVPATDYEELLKKSYKAGKNVFKLRKNK